MLCSAQSIASAWLCSFVFFWRAGPPAQIVLEIAFIEGAFLPLPNPNPHCERFTFCTSLLLFVLLASGVAAMLVQHAASSARGVMASRPDLKLKEGLRKVKDYRAVHREFFFVFQNLLLSLIFCRTDVVDHK